MTSESKTVVEGQARNVPLIERLRAVPQDAHLRVDTPNPLGVDSQHFPIGLMCHEAATSLASQCGGEAAWRPIETAPKDGTQLILTNGTVVAQGWWEHQEPYIREKRDMEGHYIDQDEHDGYDDWLDCEGGMQPDPTHWMPLPPPPSASPVPPTEQAGERSSTVKCIYCTRDMAAGSECTSEDQAERCEGLGAHGVMVDAAMLICPRCKVDRYKQPCGDPHYGVCPMTGTTDVPGTFNKQGKP